LEPADGIACVAGVNGKGEGERERGRKMGFWELAPSPPSPAFLFPFPLPFYACYAGYGWKGKLKSNSQTTVKAIQRILHGIRFVSEHLELLEHRESYNEYR